MTLSPVAQFPNILLELRILRLNRRVFSLEMFDPLAQFSRLLFRPLMSQTPEGVLILASREFCLLSIPFVLKRLLHCRHLYEYLL